MNGRSIAVFLSIVIISISTLHPAIIGSENVDIACASIPTHEYESENAQDEIDGFYDQLVTDISNNQNPRDVLRATMRHPVVKDNIQSLYGKKTYQAARLMFSPLPKMVKNIELLQFNFVVQQIFKNDDVQQALDSLSFIDSGDINSYEDFLEIDEIPDEIIDVINQTQTIWSKSERAQQTVGIANDFGINETVFWLTFWMISILVWTLGFAGLATLYSEFALYYSLVTWTVESVIISIGSTSLLGEFLIDETPFYDYLAQLIFKATNGQFGHELGEHFFSSILAHLVSVILVGLTAGPLMLNVLPTPPIVMSKWIFILGVEAWLVPIAIITAITFYNIPDLFEQSNDLPVHRLDFF